MSKSLIATLLFGVTVTGFAGLAKADYRQCAMPITKGGCPIWTPQPQPGPMLPHPKG